MKTLFKLITGFIMLVGAALGQSTLITPYTFGFQCGVDPSAANCPSWTWPTTLSQPGIIRLWDSSTYWGTLEHNGQAQYSWGNLDNWLDLIASRTVSTAAGNVPLQVDYSFGSVPFWAETGGSNCCLNSGSSQPPDDLTTSGSANFNQFVTALVNHCSPAGNCVKNIIKYYEAWNEANHSSSTCAANSSDTYWTGSVVQLYQMWSPAAAIIQANVPGAVLTTPAFVDTTGFATWITCWLNAEVNNGVVSQIYNYHEYLLDHTPEQRCCGGGTLDASLIAPNNGTAGWTALPLWKSETNFNIQPNWACNLSIYTANDCTGQILRWQLLNTSNGVNSLIWYYWHVSIGASGDQYDVAYNTMMQIMEGGVLTAPCSSSGAAPTYTCSFIESNGVFAKFVWTPNTSGTTFTVPASFVDYIDQTGAKTSVTGGQSIAITVQPIMLEQQISGILSPKGLSIPITNFGLHVIGGTGNYPIVSQGTFRLWNNNTRWQQVNTALNTYTYTTVDGWLTKLANNNVKDITYVLGGTPQWASSAPADAQCDFSAVGKGYCDAPSDLNSDGSGSDQRWRNWVAAISQHIDGSASGVKVTAWEIWEEFDRQPGNTYGTTVAWAGTNAQMARMAQDARCIIAGRGFIDATGETCTQVQATVSLGSPVDATAVILAPSIRLGVQSLTNFGNYLVAGGDQAAEGYAIHPYSTAPAGAVVAESSYSSIQAFISQLSPQDQLKPIWATEGGWGGNSASEPNQLLQAAFLARYYLLLKAGNVARNYWYAYDDASNGTLWKTGTGLTPAGTAYQVVYNWMTGASMNFLCTGPGYPVTGVYTCGFVDEDGTQMQAVWDSSQSCTSSCTTSNYTFDSKFVSYQDLTGNFTTLSGSTVPISARPIMLFNIPGTVLLQGKYGVH